MLYTEDKVQTSDSREAVVEVFKAWRTAMKRIGMKVNMSKTWITVLRNTTETVRTLRYICGVCGKGVEGILCSMHRV